MHLDFSFAQAEHGGTCLHPLHIFALLCFWTADSVAAFRIQILPQMPTPSPGDNLVSDKKKYAKMGIRSPVQAVSIESGCKLYLELELRNIC